MLRVPFAPLFRFPLCALYSDKLPHECEGGSSILGHAVDRRHFDLGLGGLAQLGAQPPFELPKEMWEKPTQNTRERSAAWREETGADFPVLGVLPGTMPEDSTLFRFDAVLDRDRRVVYVGSQSDPEGRIEEALVRRMLSR